MALTLNFILASKQHEKLEESHAKRCEEGKQLTLFETEVRTKSLEKEYEGAIRALALSTIPISRPAVNTIIAFYDELIKQTVLLADTCILKACNITSLALVHI